jgi:hypothetical protein
MPGGCGSRWSLIDRREVDVPWIYQFMGGVWAGQPGKEARAEQALLRSIEAGDAESLILLGRVLSKQPGREMEAEQLYRSAIRVGFVGVYELLLALLARQPERSAEFQRALQEAVDTGAINEQGNATAYYVPPAIPGDEANQSYRRDISQQEPLLGRLKRGFRRLIS